VDARDSGKGGVKCYMVRLPAAYAARLDERARQANGRKPGVYLRERVVSWLEGPDPAYLERQLVEVREDVAEVRAELAEVTRLLEKSLRLSRQLLDEVRALPVEGEE
jgi:hypothetical protein